MSSLTQDAATLVVQYAHYHRNRRNIVTHFIGIPMIMLAILLWLSFGLGRWGDYGITAAWLVWALSSFWYLTRGDALLAPTLSRIPVPLRFEALQQWLNALEFVTTDPRGQWTLDQFDERLGQNKRDFETRFAKARLLMAAGQMTEAMEELLEIIMRDKKWDDEAPRKTYIAILELLSPPAPKAGAEHGKSAGGIELMGKAAVQEDPQAALVSSYRRKLSMALN